MKTVAALVVGFVAGSLAAAVSKSVALQLQARALEAATRPDVTPSTGSPTT